MKFITFLKFIIIHIIIISIKTNFLTEKDLENQIKLNSLKIETEIKTQTIKEYKNLNEIDRHKYSNSNKYRILQQINETPPCVTCKKVEHIGNIYTVCDSLLCLIDGGLCNSKLKCICKQGYTNKNKNSIFGCDYEQKNAKIAFFLEFIIGFGVGHYYAKRYTFGFIKMLIMLTLFSISIIVAYFYKKKDSTFLDDTCLRFGNIISICVTVISYLVWQFTDAILFYSLFYKDGNGLPLVVYK
jgi:hypothetical protein